DLYNHLGQSYYQAGEYGESERWHRISLQARERMFPPGDMNISTANYGLAKAYIRMKRFADARKHIEICDRNEEMCESRSYLGWVLVVEIWAEYYQASGDCEKAVKCYSDLVASYDGSSMGTSAAYFDVYTKISRCYEETGDAENAGKYRKVAEKYVRQVN
ncbi:MAG TPA: tetratricopeptide repeat protein, partial [Candidatus Krumholzibacterium sp.]|nr:tetratricopeptide repeat protein [Candidatus Krumholzibacterium sp.]